MNYSRWDEKCFMFKRWRLRFSSCTNIRTAFFYYPWSTTTKNNSRWAWQLSPYVNLRWELCYCRMMSYFHTWNRIESKPSTSKNKNIETTAPAGRALLGETKNYYPFPAKKWERAVDDRFSGSYTESRILGSISRSDVRSPRVQDPGTRTHRVVITLVAGQWLHSDFMLIE